MQFAVPQFTEVEDRLIGSLTLKQFLVLLAAGGVILFFWSILGPSFPFFLVAIPIGLFGVAAAMGKYNGRPLFTYLVPLAAFMASTKVMVFKREAMVTNVSRSQPEPPKAVKAPVPEADEPAESRLKKLAYLLDNKSEEEGSIISHDFRQDIVVPQAPKIDMTAALTRAGSQIRERISQTARALDGTKRPAPAAAAAKPRTAPASSPRPPAEPSRPQPRKFDPSSFLQI